jgi:hypothetical protein
MPGLGRLSQEELEFKASLGYTATQSPKTKIKSKKSLKSANKMI